MSTEFCAFWVGMGPRLCFGLVCRLILPRDNIASGSCVGPRPRKKRSPDGARRSSGRAECCAGAARNQRPPHCLADQGSRGASPAPGKPLERRFDWKPETKRYTPLGRGPKARRCPRRNRACPRRRDRRRHQGPAAHVLIAPAKLRKMPKTDDGFALAHSRPLLAEFDRQPSHAVRARPMMRSMTEY